MKKPVLKSEIDKEIFDPKGMPVKGFKKIKPLSKESVKVKM